MKEKILIAVKLLSDEQKKRLAEGTKANGYEAVFAENEEDALAQMQGVKIILSSYPVLAKAAPDLQWLCTPYAGVEEYTRPGAFLSGNAVLTNSSGAYGVTIAEHTVMVTLEVLRNQMEYAQHISNKQWVRKLPTRSICQSRVLIAGTGDIGQEVALRFRSFRPEKITGVNRHGKKPGEMFDEAFSIDKLDQLLPETDIFIMALPGTEQTRHILNQERLALLPDFAVVVNVGRGSCIDEEALAAELMAGRLYAALDVFETEPLPESSPLWNCRNLLITPHVAGDLTLPYTRDRVIDMFLEDLPRYRAGEPLLHRVDLITGY